jgi:hypothetical protein
MENQPTVIAYLEGLNLQEEALFESVGQILDSMVQVLEHVILKNTNQLPNSVSLGDLESSLLEIQESELAKQLGIVRKLRKNISIVAPALEAVTALRNAVIELIKYSQFGYIQYEQRVRYQPALINSTGVETQGGFGKFNLYHGSITRVSCDTLVISAFREGDKFDGQVYNAVNWMFSMQNCRRTNLINSDELIIHHYDTGKLQSSFNNLLILEIGPLTDKLEEEIETLYKRTFAALEYLRYSGVNVKNTGVSFLFGNSVKDKGRAIEKLIQQSLLWLNQANLDVTIHCAVFYTKLIDLFNETMNQTLNRSSISEKENPILNALLNETRDVLKQQPSGPLDEGIKPLKSALSITDNINVELICTFSRTLCELIVREVHKWNNLKLSHDLLSSIEKLRSEGLVSPWICSYMHGLRILGNKSVHPNRSIPAYLPAQLDYNDLLNALSGLKALIEFYNVNIRGREDNLENG